MVQVLRRLGYDTFYDPRQTCCGQALFNMGFRTQARDLAVRFIQLFENAEVVVSPGGSCVSMVVKHYAELDLPPVERRIWESLRERIWEFTSFLVYYKKITQVGAYFPHSVALHRSCHLLRDLGIKDAPDRLLEQVEGLELIPPPDDECCGWGGAFSVKYPGLSRRISDRRANNLAVGGAEFITGVDDSCLINLQNAFHRLGLPQKTMHIARILARTN